MKPIYILPLLLHFFCFTSGFAQNDTAKRYIKTPAGYLMVLKENDNIFEMLESFAKQENIPSANFTGMGFAEVELGFFNSKTKKYKAKKLKPGEVASMQGSIAWQDGKPSLHAHGLITDKKFRTRGGHILGATVGKGTMEIMIIVHDHKLERKRNEQLGANELCLWCK